MKIPVWIKALAYLRFVVTHDGIVKNFWSYEKALKYKNGVLADSEDLTFKGFHVLRGWLAFYIKISSPLRPKVEYLPENLIEKLINLRQKQRHNGRKREAQDGKRNL